MYINKMISQMRDVRGLTQHELAEMLNVSTNTVGNWERGVKKPSVDNLINISRALRCSVSDLVSDNESIDFELKTLEDKCRQLDKYGRAAVNAICDAELARMRATYVPWHQGKPSQSSYIPLYNTPSAAGVAAPIEGSDFEMVSTPDNVPDGTDYLVRISGASMEPTIPDGALACVKECKTLHSGDIGIFCVNGTTYCKKYSPAPDGTLRLVSVNRKYAYADISVSNDSTESVACCGKVLGVVTK